MATILGRQIARPDPPQEYRNTGLTRLFGPEWVTISGVAEIPVWLPIIYKCLSLLMKRVSGLNVEVLNDEGESQELPIWAKQPNRYLHMDDLIEGAVYSLLQCGQWAVIPVRHEGGEVISLVVPDPTSVAVKREDDGTVNYYIDGEIWPGEIIYIPWILLPGHVQGVGAIGALRALADIGGSAQDYVQKFLDEGLLHQHVFTANNMTEEALRDAEAALKAKYSGVSGAWRPMLLTGEIDLKPMNMNMADAQFLDLVQWNDAKICAQIYHIDPSFAGVVLQGSALTYTNQQQRESQLYIDAVQPLKVRIERALSLLLPGDVRFHLNEKTALQGSLRDRIHIARDLASLMIAGYPVFTRDEIRDLVGFPPFDPAEEVPPYNVVYPPPMGLDSGEEKDETKKGQAHYFADHEQSSL